MSSSTMSLKSMHIESYVKSAQPGERLWVYDFDNTLVHTDSKIHVLNPEQGRFSLTSEQFAVYEKHEDDVFDYSDFHKLVNPRTISWTNSVLEASYAHHGPDDIVILSARSVSAPIAEFLKERELHGIEIVALNSADPAMKARWVDEKLRCTGYKILEFLDDSHKNVAAIQGLSAVHPRVRINAHLIDDPRPR